MGKVCPVNITVDEEIHLLCVFIIGFTQAPDPDRRMFYRSFSLITAVLDLLEHRNKFWESHLIAKVEMRFQVFV